jgi:hypothetical protein
LPPGEYHEQVIVSTDNYQFRIPLSFRVVGLPIPAGAVLDEAPVIVSTNIVQSDSDPRNVSPILVQRSQIKPNQTPSNPSNDSNSSSPKKNRNLLERIFWGNK